MIIQSMPPRTHHIHLPSGSLTYCDIGDSETSILLLHGLSFRLGLYPLIERLIPHFRVVALDLPFVKQDPSPANPGHQGYVDLILEFISAKRLKNPAIFGNSLGGTLGLMCALDNPATFSKLILRAPLWTRLQLPGYLRLAPLVIAHQWLSGLDAYAKFALDTIYTLSEKMSPRDDNAAASTPHKDLLAQYQVNPTVLSAFLGRLVQVELSDQIPNIPNPTLVLWGQLDTLTPSIWGARLSQYLPEARFLEVAGEYHNMATTDPDALAENIKAFILA